MSQRPVARLLVCGSVDRQDDGAAVWATAMLLPTLRDEGRWNVELRRCGQLDIEHLLEVPAGVPVMIVDAAVGLPAGKIVTLTLDDLLQHPHGPAPHSSHALPIDQVVGVARMLSDEPIDGLFVGVGGENFGYGESMSDAVRAALPAFAEAIAAAIVRLSPAVLSGPG